MYPAPKSCKPKHASYREDSNTRYCRTGPVRHLVGTELQPKGRYDEDENDFLVATLALAVCMLGISPLAHAQAAPGKVEVTGKAECKVEKKDGKDVKVCTIAVTVAKGSDGKAIADVKSVSVAGTKPANCEKMNGKEVIAKGTLSADKKVLTADSIAEKPASKK